MNSKKQIEEWVSAGTISQDQAKIMLAEINEKGSERQKGNIVNILATIGSVLIGVGIISMIAANWEFIPSMIKVLILLLSTFATFLTGYYFSYIKKNLPKVGNALIFLSTLIFGASIFLIAQIYNVPAGSNQWLLMLWLIGILPLVYLFNSVSISVVSLFVFMAWFLMTAFGQGQLDFWDMFGGSGSAPIFLTIVSLSGFVYLLGQAHCLYDNFKKIGKAWKVIGIEIFTLCIFIAIWAYGGIYAESFFNFRHWIPVFSLIVLIGLLINTLLTKKENKADFFENMVALSYITIYTFIIPLILRGQELDYEDKRGAIIFHLLFGIFTVLLMILGYLRNNLKVVNIGIFWFSLFVFAEYTTWFWDLLPKGLFFIFGGIMLVSGAIFIEKNRRVLKQKFLTN